MNPQIIVCGLGRAGYKILCLLQQQGVRVVGIHHEPLAGTATDIRIGDARSADVLIAAGIRQAQTLVLTHHEDGFNLAVLMQARVLNPQIRIVNRLFNEGLGDRLDHTLPDHISMSVAALSAPVFAFAALGDAAIGTGQQVHGWELLDLHLQVGDVLYLTMPGNQLELLWQTLPSRFMREQVRRQG